MHYMSCYCRDHFFICVLQGAVGDQGAEGRRGATGDAVSISQFPISFNFLCSVHFSN